METKIKEVEQTIISNTTLDKLNDRTTYTYDEAFKISKSYFNNEELPANVFLNKYAMKDLSGKIYETNPEQMHRRLAKEFARIEYKFGNGISDNKNLSQYGQTREFLLEERIYDLFKDFKYIIPQGSVMSMLGNEFMIGSLSNCFVLSELYDSYGGILYADQQLIQLSKRRAGVGLDITSLRPEKMAVTNAAGSSTGAISFMERFSNSCREVAQNGRRGALMISCFGPKTFVLTDMGWENIVNVINAFKSGINKKAWTHDGFKDITDVQIIENRELYDIETEDGKKLQVTADHKFVVKNIITNEEYLKALIDIDINIEEIVIYE